MDDSSLHENKQRADATISVVFDYQAFSMQKIGGVSRYFAYLINELYGVDDIQSHLDVVYASNQYLKAELGIDSSPLFHRYQGRGCGYVKRMGDRANKYATRRLFKKHPRSVYHPTYFDPWYVAADPESRRVVVTVHDMIHELCADRIADPWTAQNKRRMMYRADAIVAVSNSTKDDIISFYPELASKTSVIHHGSSLGSDTCMEAFKIDHPYILFVGSRWGYKNFERFACVCEQLFVDHPDLRLICAGGGLFSVQEGALLEKLNLTSRATQCFVSDGELKSLYQGAQFFVFPSQYEGFGLPVLEAMGNGAPCLLSNASSLPEVGGNAALYFDPDDKESMYRQCSRMLNDGELRDRYIQAGYARAQEFSWAKCAREHADVYRTLGP
jgi:glycosyltransferase involved in cell wall biosynthesis